MPKGKPSEMHGGFAGRTLINRIESQMDKRRKVMEDLIVQYSSHVRETLDPNGIRYREEKGRYEGMGGALAILRSSSLKEEIARSNERLGIE